MSRACCFTGHRVLPDENSEEFAALSKSLDRAIDDVLALGCDTFYAGGAIGFDRLASERILMRKKKLPALRLIICVPFPGHDSAFSEEERAHWMRLKSEATEVIYLFPHYSPFCYAARNRYMVEHTDICIAYVRNKKSGSGQTLAMAKRKHAELLLL